MIIKALSDYYDQLLRDGVEGVSRPGWTSRQVGYIIELSEAGLIRNIIPADSKRGWSMSVPEQQKRTSGVLAYFLCDTSSYFLGLDAKGNHDRTLKCFEASKELHHCILDGRRSSAAKAVLAFFDTWDPANAESCAPILREKEGLLSGKFIIFSVNVSGRLVDPLDDSEIASAWEAWRAKSFGESDRMVCLVTGEKSPIARLHPVIKGVYGSEPAGATLVGFNCRAFESYGHDDEQGLNAPVSKGVAAAYGVALDYLLQSDVHHVRLGDTTVVYWSLHEDQGNCEVFGQLLGNAVRNVDQEVIDQSIDCVMRAIAAGKQPSLDHVDLGSDFFVLGLAPNAARLSVRFFLRGTFGDVLRNICKHYEQIELVHAPYERRYLSPYTLLKEVENPNSKKPVVSSVLSGSLMRSIFTGAPYPDALYENALLRIRATNGDSDSCPKKVSYGRASIIRGYLLRNCRMDSKEITVELNRQRCSTAYALGRVFSLMEEVQEEANKKEDREWKRSSGRLASRYLNSACATPASVFPVLFRLNSAHFEKLTREKPGLASWLRRQFLEVIGEENMVPELPKRLDLKEQGEFFLGYYQQTQARYKSHGEKNEEVSSVEE